MEGPVRLMAFFVFRVYGFMGLRFRVEGLGALSLGLQGLGFRVALRLLSAKGLGFMGLQA